MKRLFKNTALSAITASMVFSFAPTKAVAGTDPFIGEISFVAFNFAPRGWSQCDGQLLAVSQNTTLYSLLGDMYGGDGRTNFALPDMRGRVPVHKGTLPGGLTYRQGMRGGSETVRLSLSNLPSHTHTATAASISQTAVSAGTASVTSTLKAANTIANTQTAGGSSLANALLASGKVYSDSTAPTVAMHADSVASALNLSGLDAATQTTTTVTVDATGTSQEFPILQPFTVVNCIIATEGTYPPRQ